MGEDWKECIITLLDVVGVKTEAPMGKGFSVMKKLQKLIIEKFNNPDLVPKHSHVYLWNDSALLIAYLKDELSEKEAILREVNKLKRYIDKNLSKSTYAIVVQGLAFPQNELPLQVFDGQLTNQLSIPLQIGHHFRFNSATDSD